METTKASESTGVAVKSSKSEPKLDDVVRITVGISYRTLKHLQELARRERRSVASHGGILLEEATTQEVKGKIEDENEPSWPTIG